jgi:ribosomal protein L11 methyltransferase
MKTYLEIAVEAPQSLRDILVPAMTELGCHGFQDTDAALLCYFDESTWVRGQKEKHLEDIRLVLRTISSNAVIRFREFPEENWNAVWEQSIQPVEAGPRFVIVPSWREYAPRPGQIVLTIDPKMSFGTGHHETTRLMIRLLERYLPPAATMLDAGTGTGILAIAAARLGALHAEGIDIDPWSIENARENVAANGVDTIVRISDQSTARFRSGQFDLIAANLTLQTNIEFTPEFSRILKPGGVLLLSGLLLHDRNAMLAAIAAARFSLADAIEEQGWLALAARLTE